MKIGAAVNIYPTPVKDMLFIKSGQEFSSYSVYNMAGQKVSSDKMTGKSINLSRLPVGSYVLKLTDKEGNTESAKFMKN